MSNTLLELKHKKIALTGTEKSLSSELPSGVEPKKLFFRADGTNTNAAFVGTTGNATDGNALLEIHTTSGGSGGKAKTSELTGPLVAMGHLPIDLSKIYVNGTNGEAVNVYWLE